ncbi:NAD-dependent epimerase/dehydratase family protein [Klenkia terrae]|uniref:NAD-dependent epimerase/dehydratase family protein n=1 Tax=Klenkia terrae TaxID=1052259 RepID=UPI00360BD901
METLRVGSVGTWHALEAARRTGARMVLASTSETYGDPQVHPQPESYWGHVNPVGPRGVYDEAKRFGEAITTAYRTAHGVDTAIVRIFNTYGPRMRREDGRAIPTFVAQALSGQPMTVAGDGSQTRSVCYVDDTVRGVLAVAASGLPGPFNVGYPEERSVLAIAQAVGEAVGTDPGWSSSADRWTTRRCAARTSPRSGPRWAGSRRCPSPTAWPARSTGSAPPPRACPNGVRRGWSGEPRAPLPAVPGRR